MTNNKSTSIAQIISRLAVLFIGLVIGLGNTMQASGNINLPTPNDSIVKISTISVSDVKHSSPDDEQTYDDEPLEIVEQMPEYTEGGLNRLYSYIAKNLTYPVAAQENKVQGCVLIRFVVRKDGSVTDVTVVRGIDPLCDEAAVRLVKNMPKWEPGKQNGQNVSVYLTLPFVFKLNKENKEGNDDTPYISVEQMPMYPGGEKSMQAFIMTNLTYPMASVDANAQGRVVVRFVIRKDGEVTDATVVKGVDRYCDEEAIRMVKSMPKWAPGKQDGKEVDVYFTLPLVFRLNKSNSDAIPYNPNNPTRKKPRDIHAPFGRN